MGDKMPRYFKLQAFHRGSCYKDSYPATEQYMQIPDVLDLLQHHFTVAELIPGVLGHSEVVLLAFFLLLLFFYHMVVGLKAELGRFLH